MVECSRNCSTLSAFAPSSRATRRSSSNIASSVMAREPMLDFLLGRSGAQRCSTPAAAIAFRHDPNRLHTVVKPTLELVSKFRPDLGEVFPLRTRPVEFRQGSRRPNIQQDEQVRISSYPAFRLGFLEYPTGSSSPAIGAPFGTLERAASKFCLRRSFCSLGQVFLGHQGGEFFGGGRTDELVEGDPSLCANSASLRCTDSGRRRLSVAIQDLRRWRARNSPGGMTRMPNRVTASKSLILWVTIACD